MDLGIAGRRALVCAASKGLGRGCAEALRAKACDVTIVARTEERAAQRQPTRSARRPEREVRWRRLRHHDRRRAARRRSPRARSRTSSSTTPAARRPATSATGTARHGSARIDANMLTPIELIKATVDGMIARKFGRIVNITSAAVKAPIDVLGLSNGARSGLTGFVAGRRAQRRPPQRDHQQPAAGSVRHRPARGRRWRRARRPPANRRTRRCAAGARRIRPVASAPSRSSAPRARSCAASHAGYVVGPESSCSTAASIPARSESDAGAAA